ncbi:hypothetical protein SAMN05216191_112184 [Paenibacillus jilunlii]|uniref:Uncharacterized protein n=1 Tax=Paenibacillus jilunlii TaxID=682956 RepID=A0A1G9T457_9BACL|nr:hypothetical protein AML91_02115 [Paenibacillus jilunlii]SDM42430.1 hypothetical protein SAMN05216191_112184 [Paenibacillus jilunlii]
MILQSSGRCKLAGCGVLLQSEVELVNLNRLKRAQQRLLVGISILNLSEFAIKDTNGPRGCKGRSYVHFFHLYKANQRN